MVAYKPVQLIDLRWNNAVMLHLILISILSVATLPSSLPQLMVGVVCCRLVLVLILISRVVGCRDSSAP
jgi:hypothetical protein